MTPERLFAALVACQAVHSLEEATFGLYRWLPYLNWIEPQWPGGTFVVFVAINLLFVSFGVWCYLARVRPRAPGAGAFVMLWVVIEILNGIGHPAWSLIAGTYVPGTATAPFLLVVATLLLWRWDGEERLHPAP